MNKSNNKYQDNKIEEKLNIIKRLNLYKDS